METETLTWTPPAEIDGEPEDVVGIVRQQLVELAEATATLVADSYIQLRAEALEYFETLEEWEQSPGGQAAAAMRERGLAFCESIRSLGP